MDVYAQLPQHLFSLPLCWAKLHDHTTKGHCPAVKKLCSGELVEGHKQKLFTLYQHKLMNQLKQWAAKTAKDRVYSGLTKREGEKTELIEEGCEGGGNK